MRMPRRERLQAVLEAYELEAQPAGAQGEDGQVEHRVEHLHTDSNGAGPGGVTAFS